MKISKIIVKNLGPIKEREFDFKDSWNEVNHDLVLFSGSNGSGKSTMLKMIASVWEAIGEYLESSHSNNKASSFFTNTQFSCEGCALIFDNFLPQMDLPVGFVFSRDNKWSNEVKRKYQNVKWYGQGINNLQTTLKSFEHPSINQDFQITDNIESDIDFYNTLSAERKKLILNENSKISNIIYFDAEDRRWVKSTKQIGKTFPDEVNKWLTTYRPTNEWKSQLENSLINLKIIDDNKYKQIIDNLNSFLTKKKIDPTIKEGSKNRLRVVLDGDNNSWHSLDELSSGEHQIMILIYFISRWLQPGGIVLIDEPDLFLHPSLISGLLSSLESIIKAQDGQLIMTSHVPEVWERYETLGKRVRLDEED